MDCNTRYIDEPAFSKIGVNKICCVCIRMHI